MKEPNPDHFSAIEYKHRLKRYRDNRAKLEAKQIASAREYLKVCERCGTMMFNVSKQRKYCLGTKKCG